MGLLRTLRAVSHNFLTQAWRQGRSHSKKHTPLHPNSVLISACKWLHMRNLRQNVEFPQISKLFQKQLSSGLFVLEQAFYQTAPPLTHFYTNFQIKIWFALDTATMPRIDCESIIHNFHTKFTKQRKSDISYQIKLVKFPQIWGIYTQVNERSS